MSYIEITSILQIDEIDSLSDFLRSLEWVLTIEYLWYNVMPLHTYFPLDRLHTDLNKIVCYLKKNNIQYKGRDVYSKYLQGIIAVRETYLTFTSINQDGFPEHKVYTLGDSPNKKL